MEILPGAVYKSWEVDLEQNKPYKVIKYVSLLNSKNNEGDLLGKAIDGVRKCGCPM